MPIPVAHLRVPPPGWRPPCGKRFLYMAFLAMMLLFEACRAPGMKFPELVENRVTRIQVGGMNVSLCPISPEVIKANPPVSMSLEAVKELLATQPTPYRVGPQDSLLVTVWDHPELNMVMGLGRLDQAAASTALPLPGGTATAPSVVVDEDGCMYYPYVGRLPVAGLTLAELRTKLTSALGKTMRAPQVDVKVLTYRSQKIYVDGEVRNPAVYAVTDVPFTLAEAANRAGGFLPTADLSRVILSRGKRHWVLNFLELTTEGNNIGQIFLKEGDSLHVSHRDEAPVYLLGELRNPRSLPLYNGRISLAQALSDAGGINSTSADARSIYVLRQGAVASEVLVFHMDAYNPVSMVLADRFNLQPRDVVYVDAGPLVRWSRVMNLIMPTFSALASTAYEIKYVTQ